MTAKLNGTKAHQRYYTSDGQLVPGVTTIINQLDKPALLAWAYNCGVQGIDFRKYRDKSADVGTCGHYLIECHLKGENPDLDIYSKDTINLAENAYIKFLEWEKEVGGIKLIHSERGLVSEKHRYGGTLDIIAVIQGQIELIDIKTGSGIYDTMAMQLAAYRQLGAENGIEFERSRIVRVGRSEEEGFETKIYDNNFLDQQFQMFWHLLQIYHIKQGVKPAKKAKKAV
jgi:hypothetical protein